MVEAPLLKIVGVDKRHNLTRAGLRPDAVTITTKQLNYYFKDYMWWGILICFSFKGSITEAIVT